jgi:hypothetical protein
MLPDRCDRSPCQVDSLASDDVARIRIRPLCVCMVCTTKAAARQRPSGRWYRQGGRLPLVTATMRARADQGAGACDVAPAEGVQRKLAESLG